MPNRLNEIIDACQWLPAALRTTAQDHRRAVDAITSVETCYRDAPVAERRREAADHRDALRWAARHLREIDDCRARLWAAICVALPDSAATCRLIPEAWAAATLADLDGVVAELRLVEAAARREAEGEPTGSEPAAAPDETDLDTLRRAIAEHGRDAKSSAILRAAGGQKQRMSKALRRLADRGEYNGYQREPRPRKR